MSDEPTERPDPVDPDLIDRPDVRGLLAAHEIGAFHRVLNENGWSQRRIAGATGVKHSEISEILKGRRVVGYDVLVRIAGSLGISRERMGLSFGAYAEEVTTATPPERVDEDVLRRHFQHLLALSAAAACGGETTRIGELATGLTAPSAPVDLPSRIGAADVAAIRSQTGHLRILARTYGGQARAAAVLTESADQWLTVDASDAARRALLAELSELHTITAWCCHDVGAVARSHYHFGRAVELAIDAGDAYRAADAMRNAGSMLTDRSQPNNALKLLQLAGLQLSAAPRDDPRVPVLRSWLAVVSAYALARLEPKVCQGQARSSLAKARDGWEPPSAHARADMDLITALTLLHLGRLDSAEAAVTTSIQTWKRGTDRREGVVADITLARLHVQASDRDGLPLAAAAIDDAARLRSGLARELHLTSLADALGSRPGSDAQSLAHRAREVATTRA
ncbi:MAG: helix-turn-helix transcriptional regulator [Pseudonocardiales bacterium]|nr:helix-turn-helix transcriptional regulator [Pseudonocardiales bacterium]MBV9032086.1 helix-turn-helix transcriptional regulator [Pseudonocardiales bacterium]MBW0008610.1 helix-turn-helix transcriptional regulator [Pseudonocardiales bacterium]